MKTFTEHSRFKAFRRVSAWDPILAGGAIFILSGMVGVYGAFPSPDAPIEAAYDFAITWNYAWLAMQSGLLLIAVGLFLAVSRWLARIKPNKQK